MVCLILWILLETQNCETGKVAKRPRESKPLTIFVLITYYDCVKFRVLFEKGNVEKSDSKN
ncbi:hypothetical protein Bhyg_12902 [Pseudolycoriella hygida]|uniref:Uncharacterized protein n=1 Tax=Pseudolycoriella hygida TaxID=35572 RepID=A0A9Q0S1M6_9DIPT|nr:hypothetical protein Bhyg_12902 [Pseudolycoriella hygida]